MADKEVLLTPDGLSKLEKELDHLKTVKRREVAARIKQALEFGDISENSEYDDAKNEQAFVEGRIATLEKMLRNARVIDQDEVDTDTGHRRKQGAPQGPGEWAGVRVHAASARRRPTQPRLASPMSRQWVERSSVRRWEPSSRSTRPWVP